MPLSKSGKVQSPWHSHPASEQLHQFCEKLHLGKQLAVQFLTLLSYQKIHKKNFLCASQIVRWILEGINTCKGTVLGGTLMSL